MSFFIKIFFVVILAVESTSVGFPKVYSKARVEVSPSSIKSEKSDVEGKRITSKPLPWHVQIRRQCYKFRNRSMRSLCLEEIAKNPTIVAMGDGANGKVQRYSRGFSIRNPISLSFVADRSIPMAGLKCDLTCPSSLSLPMSISPSQLCSHEDPYRFPQLLRLKLCSCRGCIDPVTGKEDVSYASRALTTNVTILRLVTASSFDSCDIEKGTCIKQQFPVSVGCHCVVPYYTNP